MSCPTVLTRRQLRVIRLISSGMEHKEVAHTLDRSASTIRNHVSNIMRRLGARNVTHAAAMVARCAMGRSR